MRHWLLLPFAAVLGACSSSSGTLLTPMADAASPLAVEAGDAHETPESATAPDTSTGGEDAAVDAGAICNTLANTAATVTTQQVASDPPAPEGGTVADGTYTLTQVDIYTGPNGPAGPSGTAQTTLKISGSTVQVASSGQPTTRTVDLATSGTSFTSTDTCPDTTVLRGTYTATATTFAIQIDGGTDDAGARTLLETFTKQ
jgi:hypothetical protein